MSGTAIALGPTKVENELLQEHKSVPQKGKKQPAPKQRNKVCTSRL